MLLVPREGDGLPRRHEKGVRVRGAWIPDALDLEGCRVDCDLSLFACRFDRPPNLRSATLDGLYLNGSSLPGLGGDRLNVKGGVFLRGVTAEGEMRMLGAKLGGDLDCSEARFAAETDAAGTPGVAFGADRLDAAGGVVLERVTAKGAVRMLGAKLGGDLDCSEARFAAETDAAGTPGVAFGADRLDAAGGVVLERVTAKGAVRLLGAKLGGGLDCTGARFAAETDAEGTPGDAFSADRLDAKGGVVLRDVTARGAVRLVGARIGGDLSCDGATFGGAEGAGEPISNERVLSLDSARIDGALILREGSRVAGALDLTAAEIGVLCDDRAAWPPAGGLMLDRCRYGAFVGLAPVDAVARLEWLGRMEPTRWGVDFWPQPYEQCAKVLREMGHGEDARAVLIEKERRQRAARVARAPLQQRALLRLRDRVLWHTVRHGRQPLRAAVWLAAFVGFGTVVFHAAHEAAAMRPAAPAVLQGAAWAGCADGGEQGSQLACFRATAVGAGYPGFNALVYSADTLLPIVSLGMQEYWTPDERTARGAATRVWLWLHILAGWALSLLAVAGFSGLVKSD